MEPEPQFFALAEPEQECFPVPVLFRNQIRIRIQHKMEYKKSNQKWEASFLEINAASYIEKAIWYNFFYWARYCLEPEPEPQ